MDLTGHYSNPSGPLSTLLAIDWNGRADIDGADSDALPVGATAANQSIGSQHRRSDWVQEAVIRVLEQHPQPMQAREVHAAVEALLGESVRWGSVKACLAANVAGPSPRFVRVAPGRYASARSPS